MPVQTDVNPHLSGRVDYGSEDFALGLGSKKNVADLDKTDWTDFINGLFQHERSVTTTERYEREYDQNLCNGRYFEDDELTRLNPKYRDLRTNLLRQPVQYLMQLAKERRIEGRIYPANGQFSPDEAKKLAAEFDKRLQSVLNFTDYHAELFSASRDAAISGEGYLRERLRRTANGERLEFSVEYVDWRNIWTDARSRKSDLSDAKHLFFIQRMDTLEARMRWPEMIDDIAGLSNDSELRAPVRDEQEDYFLYGEDQDLSRYSISDTKFERYRQGRPILYVGECYFKIYNSKTAATDTYRCQFAYDENMDRMLMLRYPHVIPHAHGMIPFSRITFDRDDATNQPYSPLVRHRRGYEKVVTALLRMAVRMASSRGIVINMDELSRSSGGSRTVDKIVEEYRRELASATPVLKEYGAPGTLRVNNLNLDVDKVAKVMDSLLHLMQVQGAVAPELTGSASPNIAGVSLAAKREEAVKAFPTFFESQDQAVKGICERLLSLIEQYSGDISYGGVIGPSGDITEMPDDEDASISGNRVKYHIVPQVSDRAILREQANALTAVIQKMDPKIAMGMMPILVEMSGVPDAQKWKVAFIELAQQNGVPIPPSLLTEEGRKQAEQDAQMAREKNERQEQLSEQEFSARINEIYARTDKNSASAFKDMMDVFMSQFEQDSNAQGQVNVDDMRKTFAQMQQLFEETQTPVNTSPQGEIPPDGLA